MMMDMVRMNIDIDDDEEEEKKNYIDKEDEEQ